MSTQLPRSRSCGPRFLCQLHCTSSTMQAAHAGALSQLARASATVRGLSCLLSCIQTMLLGGNTGCLASQFWATSCANASQSKRKGSGILCRGAHGCLLVTFHLFLGPKMARYCMLLLTQPGTHDCSIAVAQISWTCRELDR